MQNKGQYAVQGHSRSPILVPIEKLIYNFALLTNTNLPPILHRYRDIAFDSSQIATFWLPALHLTSPTEGFPWDELHNIIRGCQQMAKVPNGVETLPKNFNQLSRAHECYI